MLVPADRTHNTGCSAFEALAFISARVDPNGKAVELEGDSGSVAGAFATRQDRHADPSRPWIRSFRWTGAKPVPPSTASSRGIPGAGRGAVGQPTCLPVRGNLTEHARAVQRQADDEQARQPPVRVVGVPGHDAEY